ncbi:ABC transporter permease [Corynebacterium variabile]|uniref:ABC transporter permease n=1 Tax=Corynebacterium variabile TaxID=1727 RepID=UPI0035E3EC7F
MTVATPAPPEDAPPRRVWRTTWPMLIGIIFTLGLLFASLFTGVYDITGGEDGWDMFFITRVPRTVALALAGAAMAMCGLVMQLLTQNKFVEPTTTGTTEWAGFGLITTMVLIPGASLTTRMIGAIIFSFVGTGIFFLFLRQVRLKSSLIVPIVGMMLGAVVGSVSTFVALKTDMLQQLSIWFTGSFTGIVRGRYELLYIVLVVLVLIFIVADRFTVAGLGKDIATNVGLNYGRVQLLGIGMVAVVTGIVTVVVGNLPFLGLIVPNIISMFRGDNLRSNLPWVVMLGMWILILADIFARTVIAPFEVPVSLVLGILGAVVFVFLLVRGRRHAR